MSDVTGTLKTAETKEFAMSAQTVLPLKTGLFPAPMGFVRSRLEGTPEWGFVPLADQEHLLRLVGERFETLPWGSPLAAYGLGVLFAMESVGLSARVARRVRDALIERVERGVLVEMVRAGVIATGLSQRLAA